ncbi:MAG: DUF928 domain-containing protein [Cyanobacteria bacterium P01_G01_bin.67]
MFNYKYIASKFNCFLALFIVLNFFLLSFAHSAMAEQNKGKAKSANSDFGLPTHRRDGGSRGNRDSCLVDADDQSLMALIPENTIGVNSNANPRLFFYVPKINNQKTLEFVLRNEQDELIYEAFFATEGDGIMSVEVPANINSNLLATGENYHWYLSMICDRQQRSRDLVVEGWLRQESIDLATQEQIDVASSVEQAEVYNSQGFWYDALSVLAENQDSLADRPIVRQKWSEMLDSVGLKELAAEPFVETELIESSPNSW